MLDTLQLYLALIILAITVMISIIVVQVYFILREFRSTFGKINQAIDKKKETKET